MINTDLKPSPKILQIYWKTTILITFKNLIYELQYHNINFFLTDLH